ncbi:MAG: hypothetical protein WBG71_01505 [Leeuwenhoekiella sp.]
MKVKNSIFAPHILKEVELPFGNFYFFNNFIVSEVHEGALFDWKAAVLLIEEAESFFGKLVNIHYVSNRINKYAVEPTGWRIFSQKNKKTASTRVVAHQGNGKLNLTFERHFYSGEILEFNNLQDAISSIPDKNF